MGLFTWLSTRKLSDFEKHQEADRILAEYKYELRLMTTKHSNAETYLFGRYRDRLVSNGSHNLDEANDAMHRAKREPSWPY